MKFFPVLLVCMSLCLYSGAQTINVNPDPDGALWIVGGIPSYTQEYIEFLNEIPELQLTQISSQTPLPGMVDNSKHKYMRPIFRQLHNSCSPAAGIAYNFTYEINRLRDIDVSNIEDTAKCFPTHFTYNFLNLGKGSLGCSIFKCWDIVKEQGCPSILVYGGMSKLRDTTHWMSGYTKYDSSLVNRLHSYSKIKINDSSKLTILKHWLNDHNEGDSIGGLANFTGFLGNPAYAEYKTNPDSGMSLIKHFGTWGGHALTIVGYNDSVKYDFNNDSIYSNNMYPLYQPRVGCCV